LLVNFRFRFVTKEFDFSALTALWNCRAAPELGRQTGLARW
jgi:hypothetical protein